MTTIQADFPVEAADKWSWVWKALVWAIFLPLTLRTKLRIESLVLVMLLSAAAIAIAGGIKTAAGGGGYGSLQLLLNENYGLYEGSIRSEEHTSELQSLMRISYAVFCLKKKKQKKNRPKKSTTKNETTIQTTKNK